jgi:hypothetical protein
MEEKEGDQPVKDQAVKQQEDEGDPVVLEVHKSETVGSSSQMG